MIWDIIMWTAMTLSVSMYAPQTYKTIKTKDASTLSKTTFHLLAFATIMFVFSTSLNPDMIGIFVANLLIAILTLPIFYYIWINKKMNFYAIAIILLGAIGAAIYLTIVKPGHPQWLQYIFATFSAGIVAVALWPQSIKIAKNKRIHSFSLITSILILIANLIWAIYWIYLVTQSTAGDMLYTSIMGVIASFSSILTQSLILLIWLKYEKKA